MKLKKYKTPQAIEQLVFRMKPELVEKWIETDYEIWTKGLAEWPGFAGKEIWVSRDRPGEVTAVVYWTDYALWKAIDSQWLAETEKQFAERFGAGNAELIGEGHNENQLLKVCETVEVENGEAER